VVGDCVQASEEALQEEEKERKRQRERVEDWTGNKQLDH
jgi:hypothetical protein